MSQQDIREKKAFFSWLVEHVRFKKREVYWMINYLVNHEAILKNVHLVEDAAQTPRGLVFTSHDFDEEALQLHINGHHFTNPEQIFHEIRLNWKKDLFVECIFPSSWNQAYYLGILEDNPFSSWNDQISRETKVEVQEFIEEQAHAGYLDRLYQEIDRALEAHDKERFEELTKALANAQQAPGNQTYQTTSE